MRIMGNLYTDNLIGTVIGLSVADDWEGARREWEIVGCEVDETHSATCYHHAIHLPMAEKSLEEK